MRKDSPCLHCEKSGTVHTRCNGYNEYHIANEEKNRAIYDAKEVANCTYDIRQTRFKRKVAMR